MRRLAFILAVLLGSAGLGSANTAGATGVAAASAAAPAKSFKRGDLESEAVRTRAALRKDGLEQAKGHSAEELYASGVEEAASDPAAAAEDFGGAIAAGRDDAAVWLNFATVALSAADAVKDDDDRRTQLTTWAPAAAYISYQRASNRREEAAALSALGDIYAKQENWRPALDAYLASLKAVESASVRKTYAALREEHGFRITDYKIDSDAASARVCFQFSEALAKGRTDFANYVALGGSANAAVSTEDQQLCVEGLEHGQRYSITVRQGLPSAVEEDLLKSADYDIYVRDRSAQVHFVGRSYVLPRVGPEGVPVVSVNTGKVDVQILRIGDRNLAPTLGSDDFLNQLYRYKLESIANSSGAKIWSGSLDVEQRLNEDVTTAFPVLEAVGKMEPGVYVMQASPHSDLDTSEQSGPKPTQWFVVSDLGLTALSGENGVTALVRSLASAEPKSGVELRLVAKNNEVLATKTTDGAGTVRFDPGLARGKGGNVPAALVATTADGDYNFLNLAQPPFDFTDRGVKGRPSPQHLDAFLFCERGVYRPGETVNVTALLRDASGQAATGMPLTLVVKRPDGVDYQRVAVPDGGMGGHALVLPLLPSAGSGTWRIEAFADPKGDAVGETSFLVEDYLPERLSFGLVAQAQTLAPGKPAVIATTTQFLYGAPGKNLQITGETTVEAADSPAWPSLKGYQAGLTDESFESVTTPLPDPVTTDQAGLATVSASVPAVTASRPIEAKILLRVGEPGGRAVERTLKLPIEPPSGLIGVKKTFGNLGEGGNASFDVVAVGKTGERIAKSGLRWSLYRLNNDYQWYSDGGHWNYERVKSSKRIADGKLDVPADAPAQIAAPVTLGQHRLELTAADPSIPPTSITFDVGWSGDASAQTPDLLEVTFDKQDYAPGESLHARVHSRFAGKATLAVANGSVRSMQAVDLKLGENRFDVPIGDDWGTGAYAMVLAHRPLDAAARRMPGRAIGLGWFSIDASDRSLDVGLSLPEKIQPRSTLTIPVRLAGLQAGEEAEVTVSAVDVGILNLTRYETPKPGEFFFGQRALGTEVRDLYGFLIDGLGLSKGGIRSGGDSAGELSSEKPTQAPLARYSGIVKVGEDGTALVKFDIPAFNGTVRVAAVAWSKMRTGSAQADVIVRDPVVVAGTLPRFLNLGDRARAHFEFDNVEGMAGSYRLQLDPAGAWFFPADALDQSVRLEAGARAGVDVAMTAAGVGSAKLDARLSGPGFSYDQTLALNIEPGAPRIYRRDVRVIEPGASLSVSQDLLTDFVPGSGSLSVSVSPTGTIDVPALLSALDRYPVGCSEQIVSRALPLLYVNKLAPAQNLGLDDQVPGRINSAIALLLSRQGANGSFGLWTADSEGADVWLDSYVMDFLTRAREAGFAIPSQSFDNGLDRLRNFAANNADAKDQEALSLAYASYVLARNGRPVLGDLRYLAATRLASLSTPFAKAQIAAALALLGDRPRATQVFEAASGTLDEAKDTREYRADYGSRLRDAAAMLALVAESGLDGDVVKAGQALESAQKAPYPTSTQEDAWLVLAAQALEAHAKSIELTLDGQAHTGALYRSWTARTLGGKPVVIANGGTAPVRIVLSTSGQLPSTEPAAAHGYAIERSYYRLDGTATDISTVKQNERLVAVLKISEDEATQARLLLNDPLPAGFEIDNPELVAGGSVASLSFLSDDVTPAHTEFRDDRFVAAFDRTSEQPALFTVAYVVRAVRPGRFVHPAASIEDMYRPERFGRTGSGSVEVTPAK